MAIGLCRNGLGRAMPRQPIFGPCLTSFGPMYRHMQEFVEIKEILHMGNFIACK
ncbi:uncharacterized protein J3R85_007085 [Psidium guajava]|nr:uncharacterized protein J3R85_007085 [Psidium guajava]